MNTQCGCIVARVSLNVETVGRRKRSFSHFLCYTQGWRERERKEKTRKRTRENGQGKENQRSQEEVKEKKAQPKRLRSRRKRPRGQAYRRPDTGTACRSAYSCRTEDGRSARERRRGIGGRVRRETGHQAIEDKDRVSVSSYCQRLLEQKPLRLA